MCCVEWLAFANFRAIVFRLWMTLDDFGRRVFGDAEWKVEGGCKVGSLPLDIPHSVCQIQFVHR